MRGLIFILACCLMMVTPILALSSNDTLSDSTPLNNSENEIIGIITNKISQVSTAEIAILITVILFIVGQVILIHREHSKLKQFYTVDTYAKKLKPVDFNIKIYPKYIIKSSHDTVINLINQGEKKILITGITALGKTRTAYEVIKDFGTKKDYFVVIPARQIKLPLWVPRNFFFFKRKFILVLDDLDKYVREKVEITNIINEFEKNSQNLIVVATCKKEELGLLKKEDVYEVFKIVEQDLLSNEDGKRLAESIGKKFDPKEFDGSAGSIVFDSCKKKKYWTDFSESEKNILRSVKLLHFSNIFLPHIDILRNVYVKIFKQDNEIFNSNFNLIEKMDFLYLKENIIYCLDYYLLNVVEDYPLGNQLSSDMLSLKGVLAEMKNYDNLIYIGDAFFFKEDYQNAILCYYEVLKINPNDEKAWYSKGNALFNTEKYDKAIECYDDVLKINPNDEKAWINKGNALNNKRKYEKAIEYYDKALKISPNVAIALYNKGCVLFNIRKCDEALEFLDKALKINPNIEKENGKYKVTIVDKAGREDHNE